MRFSFKLHSFLSNSTVFIKPIQDRALDSPRQDMSTALNLPFCLVIFSLSFFMWRQSWKKYPPGPKPWPVIGNLWDMPVQRSWLRFSEWKDTYGIFVAPPLPQYRRTDCNLGDLVYLRVLGRPILILNSIEAVQDLFEKRSSIYSDRPRRLMGEL